MTNKINNIILYLLIVFSIYCALIIGLSWDNFFHMDLGNRRLKYLLSLGSNDYFSYADTKFYPGLYDTLVVFIVKKCIFQIESKLCKTCLRIFYVFNFGFVNF